MSTSMPVPPPCAGKSLLFDSTDDFEHLMARALCAHCPLVRDCLMQAVTIAGEFTSRSPHRGPDGTWGGLLWRDGSICEGFTIREEVAA